MALLRVFSLAVNLQHLQQLNTYMVLSYYKQLPMYHPFAANMLQPLTLSQCYLMLRISPASKSICMLHCSLASLMTYARRYCLLPARRMHACMVSISLS